VTKRPYFYEPHAKLRENRGKECERNRLTTDLFTDTQTTETDY